jgi:hypothetical protein
MRAALPSENCETGGSRLENFFLLSTTFWPTCSEYFWRGWPLWFSYYWLLETPEGKPIKLDGVATSSK